jgi:hypothetical protein
VLIVTGFVRAVRHLAAPSRNGEAFAGTPGTADDIAAAALAALTNGFLTGVSIPVDGGEHLA